MFSQTFLYILIVAALIWTACGAVLLISLLIRDFKNGKLW